MTVVGERFRVTSSVAGDVVLKLVAIEPVKSGPARPGLPRAEGVSLVFDSPDKAPLVACGDGIHRLSHPRLGAADLYFGPRCKRDGDHVIEVILN